MNMQAIEKLYQEYCNSRTGTAGHLPRLRQLAEQCETVVEFGVRHGCSTTAFLTADCDDIWSFDIQETQKARHLQRLAGGRWHYTIADTVKADVPEADMIFVDSMHSYEHVKAELAAHGMKAGRYLVFHDTITFGVNGAHDESGKPDPKIQGIRLAIDEFMIEHPGVWHILEHHPHSHGLLVLERTPQVRVAPAHAAKLVVYTAVIGPNTDGLHDPLIVNPEIDYVCFTDRKRMRSRVWRFEDVKPTRAPQAHARSFKFLSHRLFPEADIVLWQDASFELLVDPWEIVDKFLWKADIVALRHPDRQNIAQEGEQIINLGLAPEAKIRAQLTRIRESGFIPEKMQALTTGGFHMRRHAPAVCAFNEIWSREFIRAGHYRDQMSMDFAAALSGVDIIYADGDYRKNPYARFYKWRPKAK